MEIFKSPGFLLRICIAAGYIVLAVFLISCPNALSFLSDDMTYAFSAVLIIYGLFRVYRAFQQFKEEQV